MAYDPEDRGPVVVDEGGGYSAGMIVGVILVLVVLALIGSFLIGSMRLGGGSDTNNGGGGQPLPSLTVPTTGTS